MRPNYTAARCGDPIVPLPHSGKAENLLALKTSPRGMEFNYLSVSAQDLRANYEGIGTSLQWLVGKPLADVMNTADCRRREGDCFE